MDKDKIFTFWQDLKANPVLFSAAFVTSFLAVFAVMEWGYGREIANMTAEKEIIKTQLQSTQVQRDDYRKQVLGIKQTQGTYGAKTNTELKSEALQLVYNVRALLLKYRSDTDKSTENSFKEISIAKTDAEKNTIWAKYNAQNSALTSQVMSEYIQKYKVQATLLRDEVITRLPSGFKPDDKADYEYPTNPLGIGFIADNLEYLAKSIP